MPEKLIRKSNNQYAAAKLLPITEISLNKNTNFTMIGVITAGYAFDI